ncbi:aldo/keto reductase [Paenibacillus sp. VMFN-D1]|uniref:aldo/keto reductase n=1 Tax=Paenibacillus sp. VMFN-D1 TaxID=2135608 RepID=UPI000E22C3B4|nr:aldo/keto reductase [Paenibacillus sp. VMFN-D1]RED37420.1 aryl-alcohol dehydrogenase-like predicted oxidoreductase [Paenibacillus sp. VMFN-D1]
MTEKMALDTYKLLGRSGLRVSPLSLGTMTFGEDWGWGADASESRRIFDMYADQGGNFIDTSVNYTNGSSEKLIGEFIKNRRERFVIGTKFSMMREAGNPNSGGNHRLNIIRSLEQSLRQLGTDYIDLLYLHAWDDTTSAEEIIRVLDDLVRSGKVMYLGISNTAAWRIAQMQTIADLRGWSPLVALQIEHSLAERTGERELFLMAKELGLGIVPYSPLAGGILSGKYRSENFQEHTASAEVSGTRTDLNASLGNFTPHNLKIVNTVREIAAEIGCTSAQVALRWSLTKPGVTSPIVGARTLQQLEQNLGALEVSLNDDQLKRLNDVSNFEAGYPHDFIESPMIKGLVFGEIDHSNLSRKSK